MENTQLMSDFLNGMMNADDIANNKDAANQAEKEYSKMGTDEFITAIISEMSEYMDKEEDETTLRQLAAGTGVMLRQFINYRIKHGDIKSKNSKG